MTADLLARHWDVIVIGTGIGGGTIGRALAEAGQSVLFVEKGAAGHRTEQTPLDLAMADPVARGLRGFWPDPVQAVIDGRATQFHAPLGAGPGGSSVFYAATLEAPEPHDLDDSDARPHPTGGWPVSFAQMRPWIDRARSLYHVAGEVDPLSGQPAPTLAPAPPMPAGDRALYDRLRAGGLNPYRLHVAARYLDGCAECFGRKCPRPCKMDGRSAGVEPALATGRAALLPGCEVTRIAADGARVTHVEVLLNGATATLRASRFVLAAGALSSPRVLLASACDDWPAGLGNRHNRVGRNLMFHLNEMIAVWPGRMAGDAGPSRSVGFRDLYFAGGARLGMVQAMGIDVGYGEIVHYLRQRLAGRALARLPGAMDLMRIPAAIGARMLGTAKVFVGLMEDLPYADNRVRLLPDAPGRIAFDYTLAPELLARRGAFRRRIRSAFAGRPRAFLTHRPELNFGHPCGTLRMGHDPRDSVTDAGGRVHGVDNLWVADASLFPTAMGVNPSLTIAANALRIADGMAPP